MTPDRNHLDAETVAAWMDGGLDAPSLAAAEAHASTCERCQALLATVTKTIPADAVVSGLSAIDQQRSSWWRWWLAPIAATAAAVTLWMVVPQTPMQAPPTEPLARDAAKAQPSAPQADPPAAPAPARAREDTLADSRRNAPAQANEAKATGRDAEAAKVDAVAGALKDQQGKREENALAAEMRQPAEPTADRSAQAERFREAPASPPAAAAPAIAQLRKQISAPVIVSPDTNSRWRATTPGSVERSEDGGRTWIPVRVAAQEEVLAGVSPSPLACWLVGRGGLVLLATDGANFTRLPFPEAVDLVSVSSPETRIAVITTADGRTFRTDDAGRNWRQQ